MSEKESSNRVTRRSVLSTIGTATFVSGVSVASSGEGEAASGPTLADLPGERAAFGHEVAEQYANPANFRAEIQKHAGEVIRAMHRDGYVSSSELTRGDLGTRSEGVLGVDQEGEYGAWVRDDELKLVLKVPSESHDVTLHVHPERGDVFANVDSEFLVKSVEENDDGDLTTQSCNICRSYTQCTDIPCDNCHCNAGFEYGYKIQKEYFCCCSACGCNDCGYLAGENCTSSCCNPCS